MHYEGADILISGGEDNYIKIWNIMKSEGERLITSIENGHVDRINAMIPYKFTNIGTFITASSDKTIQMWNPDCKKSIKMFLGHKKPVRCLSKVKLNTEVVIISGSEDKTLKVWNPNENKDKLMLC